MSRTNLSMGDERKYERPPTSVTAWSSTSAAAPVASSLVMTAATSQLQRAGLIERADGMYQLSPSGLDLAPLVFGLGHWAQTWILRDPEPEELDPTLLIWWGHSRLRTELLPYAGRVVLEFRFHDHDNVYWLVVESSGTSICEIDPGFGVDATITTDLRTLHRVWNGREDFRTALRGGRIVLRGKRDTVKQLPDALSIVTLGQMAESARAVSA
jgi:hypothetical protein